MFLEIRVSTEVFNSLSIDRIFTQPLTICEECSGSMKTVKGNGISKKLPPCIQKNMSAGRKVAGMNQLLLLISDHTSLGSTVNDNERQPQPIMHF